MIAGAWRRADAEGESEGGKLYVPQLREATEPIFQIQTGVPLIDELIEPLGLAGHRRRV